MAFVPPAQINDNVGDPGDLVSKELFAAISDNLNYLIDSCPVGSLIPVMVGFSACPSPDPTLWQACDGSMITDVNSPLIGTTTPNYADNTGRYMRGYVTTGTIGTYTPGDLNFKTLSHNHGGLTSVFDTGDTADSDSDLPEPINHAHPISSDLTTPINVEPVHFRVKHYIKIR